MDPQVTKYYNLLQNTQVLVKVLVALASLI